MNAPAFLMSERLTLDRGPLRTRSALLAAAERLFASRSLAAISIDDITTQAGVAKGSFYNHFRDKQSIAREIAARARDEIARSVAAVLAGGWSPPEALARGGMALLRYMIERPEAVGVLRQFTRALTLSPPIDMIADATLRRGFDDRSFRRLPREAGRLLVAGVEVVALQRTMAPGFDAAALEEPKRLAEMMMMGLGVATAEASAIVGAAAEDVLAGLSIVSPTMGMRSR